MRIENTDGIPLYYQLREIIRSKILNGEWPEGAAIPTESELMEMYGVSRQTVRQALSGLVDDGLVTRKKAKGSFVTKKKLPGYFVGDMIFFETAEKLGIATSSRIVSAEYMDVMDLDFVSDFPGNGRVFKLVRLRSADEVPQILEELYVLERYAARVEKAADLVNLLVLRYVEEKNDIAFSNVTSVATAGLPTEAEEKLLTLGRAEAVFRLTTSAYHESALVVFNKRSMLAGHFHYQVDYHYGRAGEISPRLIFVPGGDAR